jgi:hypothetical protein
MKTTDPQFIYMILVLPALFGVTLVGEGINKIIRNEGGFVNILFGLVFIIIVIFGYYFFSTYFGTKV